MMFMRYVLVFLALIAFSFALASSVMLVHLSASDDTALPRAFFNERSTTSVQAYATIVIVAPGSAAETGLPTSS